METEPAVVLVPRSGTEHRATRLAVGLLVLVPFFTVGAPLVSAASDEPQPAASEPVAKEFRSIRHYLYRERVYDPPAAVQPMDQPPSFIAAGPEEQMANLLSAMRRLQFDRWLAAWDAGSQALIEQNLKAGSPSKAQLFRQWKERFRAPEVRLIRWIETREYVIVTYRTWGPGSEDTEYPVAFKLDTEGWVATLDLMTDPVFLNFGSDETRIERDGRS